MIRVHQIKKSFNGVCLFEDVSFEVAKGKSQVILGPSGAGKTTLLKCVSGLILVDSGMIELGSRRVGMLFQKNALFDSMTLIENLIFPRREVLKDSFENCQKKARELLDAVGLLDQQNMMPGEISGGMQKRLGIARALIVEPEILLYDEPTAGLDPITSRKIAELIQSLKSKSDCTLLIVTSDIQRAIQLGDQIGLLAQKKLIEAGRPESILSHTDARIHQFVYGKTHGPLSP